MNCWFRTQKIRVNNSELQKTKNNPISILKVICKVKCRCVPRISSESVTVNVRVANLQSA